MVLIYLDNLYLQWALRQIHPLHPDVPTIIQRLNEQRPI
jgi:hypothetical protein